MSKLIKNPSTPGMSAVVEVLNERNGVEYNGEDGSVSRLCMGVNLEVGDKFGWDGSLGAVAKEEMDSNVVFDLDRYSDEVDCSRFEEEDWSMFINYVLIIYILIFVVPEPKQNIVKYYISKKV